MACATCAALRPCIDSLCMWHVCSVHAGMGVDRSPSKGASAGRYYSGLVAQAKVGDRYKYKVRRPKHGDDDGDGERESKSSNRRRRHRQWRNDPCSRFMSIGRTRNDVIVDRHGFEFDAFDPPPLEQLVIMEFHVATFTGLAPRLCHGVRLVLTAPLLLWLSWFPQLVARGRVPWSSWTTLRR